MATPIAPTDIADLKLWLDADAITGLSDGDTITTWEDQSGLNNDYTNFGSVSSVKYETNELNSKPVVALTAGGFTGSAVLGDYFSIIYVANYTVGGVAGHRGIVGASVNWLMGPHAGVWRAFAGGFTNSTAASSNYVIHVGIQASGVLTHWVYDVDSATLHVTGATAPGYSIGTLRIGTAGTNAAEALGGNLAEVIAYDHDLNPGERGDVVAYLREKWGAVALVDSAARLAREATVVAHQFPSADTAARLSREAIVVNHHYPEALTASRIGRLTAVVAISRPHGWYVFDDPATRLDPIGGGDPPIGGGDDVTPPAIPTWAADPLEGDTTVFLDWNSGTELDLVSYQVYEALAEEGPYILIATVDESQYMVTGLTNGTTYYFAVTAKDDTGNESGLSEIVSAVPAVPPGGVAPPPPTGLAAVAGDTQVSLSWNAVIVSDLNHYNVYRSLTSGGTYTLITTRTTTTFTDTGRTNGTTYWYKVSAVDNDPLESTLAGPVSAVPTAVTPPTGRPSPDVTFNSGNPYSPAKVTAEAAGKVFKFTITGGTSNGPRYENASIPTKDGNQYVFDAGTVLDGNGITALAFETDGATTGVKIWDCEWTDYLGQNGSSQNNTKGAAAIRLRGGWEMYDCYGHHNKYAAFSCDGDNIYVEGGDFSYNGQYGFKGGNCDDCEVKGSDVHHNGGISSLDVGGDTGGCKIVHSERFKFTNIHAHHNIATGTQGGNGLWTDINNLDPVYSGCTINDNEGAGIFHEVSLGFEIVGCTFTNNGQDNSDGGIHPVKANIQISNSGGNGGWIHNNTITITAGSLGFYGISLFNSNHFQWTNGVVDKGCLGVRNILVENNTINVSGSQWKAVFAITGNLPSSRSNDQFCGQQEITASGSNNKFLNNIEIITGGVFPGTPYIRAGVRISANAWLGFGYT